MDEIGELLHPGSPVDPVPPLRAQLDRLERAGTPAVAELPELTLDAVDVVGRHDDTGAGVVVAPDDIDGIERELVAMRDRWRAGGLDGSPLSDEWRDRLDRRTRVQELAELMHSLVEEHVE